MTTIGYNDEAVKDICYNCGSPVAKRSYNYFRRLHLGARIVDVKGADYEMELTIKQ